jgi:hypothetical protein
MRTVLLVLALVVRCGVDLVKHCSSAPHLLDDLVGEYEWSSDRRHGATLAIPPGYFNDAPLV